MTNSQNQKKTSSMTAFGAARQTSETGEYYCEVRCVNHRFLDVHIRLPEELRANESDFRELVAEFFQRGRVDCTIKREEQSSLTSDIEINESALNELLKLSKSVSKIESSLTPLTMSEVLRWPGVMQAREVDAELIKKDAKSVLSDALKNALQARKDEGSKLHSLIMNRVTEMQAIVENVQLLTPEIQQQYRQRLEEKLESLNEKFDDARLEQEMVIFLNKSDVMEELDRLNVHFSEVINSLEQDKPKGRRLDFLMQELNREANTLGSKSQHAQLTQYSVELKVLIEQMREQVQNIE